MLGAIHRRHIYPKLLCLDLHWFFFLNLEELGALTGKIFLLQKKKNKNFCQETCLTSKPILTKVFKWHKAIVLQVDAVLSVFLPSLCPVYPNSANWYGWVVKTRRKQAWALIKASLKLDQFPELPFQDMEMVVLVPEPAWCKGQENMGKQRCRKEATCSGLASSLGCWENDKFKNLILENVARFHPD